jgi:hypothetical protein
MQEKVPVLGATARRKLKLRILKTLVDLDNDAPGPFPVSSSCLQTL